MSCHVRLQKYNNVLGEKHVHFLFRKEQQLTQITWLPVQKNTIVTFTDTKSSIPTPHAQIHYSNFPSKISKLRTSQLFVVFKT
jgi:hypothetical protein